ncbi:MAG: septum formation family protein [Acidimicrobiia bacterium]|nr:septum formation family protein [Acidimicrobiia bacterium]
MTETTNPSHLTPDEHLLVDAILSWAPEDLVRDITSEVVETPERVVVATITPPLGVRGYPWLSDFFVTESTATLDHDADHPSDVLEATDPHGDRYYVWSDGDRLIVAVSTDDDAAASYLSARADVSEPAAVWTTGSCVHLDQHEVGEFGTLPWAPVGPDLVTPCDETHHAEVLFADAAWFETGDYDADLVDRDRAYECDREYEAVFGPQRDATPSLITYAPDADEWDRGDRYLACVVVLDTVDGGEEPLTGRLTDRGDLRYAPEPGICTAASFKVLMDCERPHTFQYLGVATIGGNSNLDDDAAACEPYLDDLRQNRTTPITVLADYLGEWAFDQGQRTVRCYAGVAADDGWYEVRGSFDGSWILLSGEGLPA